MTPPAPAPVIVLTGPTGTGKSQLALSLAQALKTRLPLEIVSADSAQVYRGMDIGTAKPSRAERAAVAHHLIDIRDPAERYSAGEFVSDAETAISAIRARGHTPLLVGGTFLYLRALRNGLAPLPAASPALRAQIDHEAAEQGWPALHGQLQQLDPAAAARIAPQDSQRIQRALEVLRLTGEPISSWQQRTSALPLNWLRFALIPVERVQARAQLTARFEAMLAGGLVDEVRVLFQRGDLTEEHPSMRSVGYRQLWQYLAGRCSLEQATSLAITATAQLAKRQMTWLRRENDLHVMPAGSVGLLETLSAAVCAAALA